MSDRIQPRRADRRKARVAKGRRIRVVRIFRAAIYLIILVVIGAIVWRTIAKVTKPYRISYAESKEITEIKEQIAQAEAENKKLKEEIEYIKRPEGKIAEARKLGFVKDGEIAVVVEQPDRQQYELEKTKMPVVEETFFESLRRRVKEFFSRF